MSAPLARVIDGLEARTGTHSTAIMYDEPSGRFETPCTKAVTGFAKGACVLDSLYHYLACSAACSVPMICRV
jgi:hypothetical protein